MFFVQKPPLFCIFFIILEIIRRKKKIRHMRRHKLQPNNDCKLHFSLFSNSKIVKMVLSFYPTYTNESLTIVLHVVIKF